VVCSFEHGNESLGSVKGKELLGSLNFSRALLCGASYVANDFPGSTLMRIIL